MEKIGSDPCSDSVIPVPVTLQQKKMNSELANSVYEFMEAATAAGAAGVRLFCTGHMSVDPATGALEKLVDKATNPRVAADGEAISFVTKDNLSVRRDGMSRVVESFRTTRERRN